MTEQIPPKLHTRQHNFDAVVVDRHAIITIAKNIQQSFKEEEVLVTIDTGGTQQSQSLTQFEKQEVNHEDKATLVRLYAQEAEGTGFFRIVQVELGPQVNFVMTQGGDQTWVLGVLEQIKNIIRSLQRNYITNFFKKHLPATQGFLLLTVIVLFPSIESIWSRVFFMTGIVMISYLLVWLHSRYLPFATIYLGQKPKGRLTDVIPIATSWGGAVITGVIIILLAAFFQGWFPPPFSR